MQAEEVIFEFEFIFTKKLKKLLVIFLLTVLLCVVFLFRNAASCHPPSDRGKQHS